MCVKVELKTPRWESTLVKERSHPFTISFLIFRWNLNTPLVSPCITQANRPVVALDYQHMHIHRSSAFLFLIASIIRIFWFYNKCRKKKSWALLYYKKKKLLSELNQIQILCFVTIPKRECNEDFQCKTFKNQSCTL